VDNALQADVSKSDVDLCPATVAPSGRQLSAPANLHHLVICIESFAASSPVGERSRPTNFFREWPRNLGSQPPAVRRKIRAERWCAPGKSDVANKSSVAVLPFKTPDQVIDLPQRCAVSKTPWGRRMSSEYRNTAVFCNDFRQTGVV